MYFLWSFFFGCVNRVSGRKGIIKGEIFDDEDNSDEGDEEDYIVYECYGLVFVRFW